ncbi:MAG: hypothetical protein MUE85_09765 [Microscillaceae bacterium]|jgi:hypothetical protein|nr:hypothetical protein [Microscillaceae bacterium]
MNKIYKFSLSLALMSMLACGGASEKKTTENKTDSSEIKTENKPKEPEAKESSEKDGVLTRSLVGAWEMQESEGKTNFTRMDFKEDAKSFEGGGGMFAAEGTYTVENGKLIIKTKGTVPDPEIGKEFNETFTIVQITDTMPYKLTLKDAEGKVLNFALTASYGD